MNTQSSSFHFCEALPEPVPLPPSTTSLPMDDDWPNCDAEAVVAALSVRYRFSRANAVQLLRDQGILRPRAEAEQDDDDDVEEAEGWGSEEDDDEEEEDGDVIIPMPGQALVSVGAMVVGTGLYGLKGTI